MFVLSHCLIELRNADLILESILKEEALSFDRLEIVTTAIRDNYIRCGSCDRPKITISGVNVYADGNDLLLF